MELYFLCCIPIWIWLLIGTAIADKSLTVGDVFLFGIAAVIPILNVVASVAVLVHVLLSAPLKRFFSFRII
jgi:hypothetical protein